MPNHEREKKNIEKSSLANFLFTYTCLSYANDCIYKPLSD